MNEYVRAGLGPFFATLTVLVGYIAVMLFPTAAEAFTPSAIIEGFLWTDGPGDHVLGDRVRRSSSRS